MSHLLRSHAPITAEGWKLLDEEARDRLAPALGARQLVDFSGPHGWQHSSTSLGRTRAVPSPPTDGVSALARLVLALIEIRADFEISRAELREGDRGADDVDLGPLDEAAQAIAAAENAAVVGGCGDAIVGIAERSPHPRVALGAPAGYPSALAAAVERLLAAGISGPFGLALDGERYRVATGGSEGGYPLSNHLREIVGGPVVRAPGIVGGVLVSMRGGDFVLDCGQDLSIGYDSHDDLVVRLYLQESFSFHVATPEAAVILEP